MEKLYKPKTNPVGSFSSVLYFFYGILGLHNLTYFLQYILNLAKLFFAAKLVNCELSVLCLRLKTINTTDYASILK